MPKNRTIFCNEHNRIYLLRKKLMFLLADKA
jgi:hypothetical protein